MAGGSLLSPQMATFTQVEPEFLPLEIPYHLFRGIVFKIPNTLRRISQQIVAVGH